MLFDHSVYHRLREFFASIISGGRCAWILMVSSEKIALAIVHRSKIADNPFTAF
jgi:hypothetical protein